MKLLLYCTKSKPYLIGGYPDVYLNGKIVAECDFEVEEIKNKITQNGSHLELFTDKLSEDELFDKSCLSRYEMFYYLKNGFTKKGMPEGYAIHIKNLHIFDKPKELSDYYTFDEKCEDINNWKPIKKAPQNMMYAYEYIDNFGWTELVNIINLNKNILISIQSKWIGKILNGEKTIEIRKKVLKEMK